MNHKGNRTEDSTVLIEFNTNNSNGASVTFTGTSVIAFKDADNTDSATAGITLNKDFAAAGNHIIVIDTGASGFYVTGSEYSVLLRAATIDSQTVNAIVGSFSIQNEFMRGTDGSLLAASAPTNFSSQRINSSGNVGISWGSVDSAGSTVSLTNTTVSVVTDVTNGVGLADDAITSAKYDESTAFPVGRADSGSNLIARTGADSDTLETLSDQIDGPVDANMTQILGTTIAESTGGRIAGNFDEFYDNSDAQTAKNVDDVGSGAATTPPRIE